MLPNTITIPLGRGAKYGHLTIDRALMPENSKDHAELYGWRQLLNDAMADKTDENGAALPQDQIVAKAQKRLDNLYSGDLRAQRESTNEPADPVALEAWKLAKANMAEQLQNLPEWKAVPKGTKDRFAATIQVLRGKKGLPELDNNAAVKATIEKYLAAPQNAHIHKAAARRVKEAEEARQSATIVDDII